MSDMCAWCGQPAVANIETAPQRFRAIQGLDPRGNPTTHKQLVRAVTAPACKECRMRLVYRQPDPAPRKTKDVPQLSVFDVLDDQ